MASSVASYTALQTPFFNPDGKTISYTWIKMMQTWQAQLGKGFDTSGNLISSINPSVSIVGQSGTLGTILANIGPTGIVSPAGLPAATSTSQGAVVLPVGATGNGLGTAALASTTAFDASGAAATALIAANTYTDTESAATLASAEEYSSDADNLTSGSVNVARLPGISVTITTAALTSGGTQGSMQFEGGLLMAQVQAT